MNVSDVIEALGGPSSRNRATQLQCPSHGGHSLSIAQGRNGKVVLHCFGGCSQKQVIDALIERGLWQKPNGGGNGKTHPRDYNGHNPLREHFYTDEKGDVRFANCKYPPGTFDKGGDWRPWTKRRNGEWHVGGRPPCPYRVVDLLKTDARILYAFEGERDADTGNAIALVSTSFKIWRAEWNRYLERFATVIAVGDFDASGSGDQQVNNFDPGRALRFSTQEIAHKLGVTGKDISALYYDAKVPADMLRAAMESLVTAELSRQPPPEVAAVENPAGETVTIGGIEKDVVTLDELNAEFALLEAPGERAVIIVRADGSPIPRDDFHLRLADKIAFVSDAGKRVPVSAAKLWRESKGKHRYRRIDFTARSVPPDVMNLFRGYGVEARQGNCTRIIHHIFEVICSGDENTFSHMIDLIAWQLQNIGRASRIIVDLISQEEQTGKGTLLEEVLLKLYGAAGYMTVNIADVTGDFNEALRGKAFLILDEALFAGDKRSANKIKGYAATQQISINAKHLPHISVPSGLNIWTMSNEKVPVYIGEEDVRHWPLRVNPCRRGDHDYWSALYKEIDNGGREAFLWQMLHHDVSHFLPQRDIPRKNAIHADIVLRSLEPSDPRNWLLESIECERLLHVGDDRENVGMSWVAGDGVSSTALWTGYKEWVRGLRGYSIKTARINDFWHVLTKAGFEHDRNERKRDRVIPPLQDCRSLIVAELSG